MAVTSPDNIRTPDSGDQYALVQDLGVLADSVQAAISRRGNLYIGTSAQRAAFTTAAAGSVWQDTDSITMIWKRVGSAWVPSVWRWSGTTAQMNAFSASAPTGFTWFSTTDNSEYVRRGSLWVLYVSSWAAPGAGFTLAGGWDVHNQAAKWTAQGSVTPWNDGFVAPVAGRYRVEFSFNANVTPSMYAAVKKNNLAASNAGVVVSVTAQGVAGGIGASVSRTLLLAAGDRLTPATYNSGAPTTVVPEPSGFSVELLK